MKLQRMCTVCRKKKAKDELLRVVKQEGIITIDTDGKIQGRGAYICKTAECIAKARKVKAFERSFSMKVNESVYDVLEARPIDE